MIQLTLFGIGFWLGAKRIRKLINRALPLPADKYERLDSLAYAMQLIAKLLWAYVAAKFVLWSLASYFLLKQLPFNNWRELIL